MKKKIKALSQYIDERIATIEKNSKNMTGEAKDAAAESLNQLKALKTRLNDLGEDEDPSSLDELKEEVTAALGRIDERLNEVADRVTALEERAADGGDASENRMKGVNGGYLKSTNAVRDFLTAMKCSKNAVEFNKYWTAKLSENGISIAEGSESAFLPDAVRGAIQDAWEKPGNWLNRLKNTGAKSYKVRLNTTEQDSEYARAKGHTKGDTKANQALTFTAKSITPQMIYKMIDVDNMTIFEDDGSLMQYVTTELVNQWLVEVQRAILVGDGRASDSAYKITSVEAMVAADSTYTTTTTHNSDTSLIDEVVGIVEDVKNDDNGDIVVFMSLNTLNTLRRVMLSETSTPQYVARDIVAEQLGVKEIITTGLLGEDYMAIAVRLDKYVTVGSLTPAFVNWEDYTTNTQNYRVEVPFGGALEGPLSCAVLAADSD